MKYARTQNQLKIHFKRKRKNENSKRAVSIIYNCLINALLHIFYNVGIYNVECENVFRNIKSSEKKNTN